MIEQPSSLSPEPTPEALPKRKRTYNRCTIVLIGGVGLMAMLLILQCLNYDLKPSPAPAGRPAAHVAAPLVRPSPSLLPSSPAPTPAPSSSGSAKGVPPNVQADIERTTRATGGR